jgi:Spy/CpxP family protein refolding chaperone
MKTSIIITALLFTAVSLSAQPGRRVGGAGPGMGMGPQMRMANWDDREAMWQNFFPPELVMRFADQLEITKSQRDAILKSQNEADSKLNTLHWDLRDAMNALQKLVEADKVDAAKSKEALTKVIDIEKQIKITQITLMIDVKNQLNEKQIAQLKEIREKQMDRIKERRSDRRGWPGGPDERTRRKN